MLISSTVMHIAGHGLTPQRPWVVHLAYLRGSPARARVKSRTGSSSWMTAWYALCISESKLLTESQKQLLEVAETVPRVSQASHCLRTTFLNLDSRQSRKTGSRMPNVFLQPGRWEKVEPGTVANPQDKLSARFRAKNIYSCFNLDGCCGSMAATQS